MDRSLNMADRAILRTSKRLVPPAPEPAPDTMGPLELARRILRPLVGAGLLVSEGLDWRHQRRTLAPAFTPKAVGLLAPHMIGPTEEAIADLRAAGDQPVNLFAAVQRLALEIAGRTMFSLEMREHSGALRDLVGRYSIRLARPHLLDVLLPVGIPTPHDIARRF